MNPKYDKFGRKDRIIGLAGIFPTMTCRYADAHCMSEYQLQEKGMCGFAVVEGEPLQPKRFAAPEAGCRARGQSGHLCTRSVDRTPHKANFSGSSMRA